MRKYANQMDGFVTNHDWFKFLLTHANGTTGNNPILMVTTKYHRNQVCIYLKP